MDTVVVGQHVTTKGKKTITRPHFTRKPLCKIKMCHAEGMGENEMFVLSCHQEVGRGSSTVLQLGKYGTVLQTTTPKLGHVDQSIN
jgi:hypothetical protein